MYKCIYLAMHITRYTLHHTQHGSRFMINFLKIIGSQDATD